MEHPKPIIGLQLKNINGKNWHIRPADVPRIFSAWPFENP